MNLNVKFIIIYGYHLLIGLANNSIHQTIIRALKDTPTRLILDSHNPCRHTNTYKEQVKKVQTSQ